MKSIVATKSSATLLVLALANCAQNRGTGNLNFVPISEAQEVQTGQQDDAKLHKECGVYNNPALQQYVNGIGHVTARHSVQQLSASTAANGGAPLLGIFMPALRNQAGDTVINVLGGVLLSGYGSEHELEADRLGAHGIRMACTRTVNRLPDNP